MANSIPSRPFPSDLNIRGSKFNVGSRGRWKELYSVSIISNKLPDHTICVFF